MHAKGAQCGPDKPCVGSLSIGWVGWEGKRARAVSNKASSPTVPRLQEDLASLIKRPTFSCSHNRLPFLTLSTPRLITNHRAYQNKHSSSTATTPQRPLPRPSQGSQATALLTAPVAVRNTPHRVRPLKHLNHPLLTVRRSSHVPQLLPQPYTLQKADNEAPQTPTYRYKTFHTFPRFRALSSPKLSCHAYVLLSVQSLVHSSS